MIPAAAATGTCRCARPASSPATRLTGSSISASRSRSITPVGSAAGGPNMRRYIGVALALPILVGVVAGCGGGGGGTDKAATAELQKLNDQAKTSKFRVTYESRDSDGKASD